jgi:Tol biopolymer transport system component
MRLPIDPATGKPVGEPEVLIPNLARFHYLSVSADGRRLLMRQRIRYSNLYKVPLNHDRGQEAAEIEPLTYGTGKHSNPVISPDGQMIAFTDNTGDSYQLFFMPVTGGEPRQLTFSGFGNVTGDWSPDGQRIAYFRTADLTGKEIMLCIADISSGTSRDVVNHSIMGCTRGWELDWAPSSSIVTKAPYCAGIWLVDPESGKTTTLSLAESDVAIRDPHFSPDTSMVAFHWNKDGQEPDGIWTKSLVDGQIQFVTDADARIIGWSPNGDWIYFYHVEGDLQKVTRVHIESQEVQTLAMLPWSVPSSANWIDLGPDASWAVVQKQTSQTDVWVVDDFDPHVK